MNGVAPDLICYFGNLAWRSIGSVGDGRVQVRENDTGPDDANHAKYGIAIMLGPGMPDTLPDDAHLFDIAPTLLTALGMDVPAEMRGRALQRVPRLRLARRPARARILAIQCPIPTETPRTSSPP